MKKIKNLLIMFVMLACFLVAPFGGVSKTASAARTKVTYEEYSADVNSLLEGIRANTERVAGSEAEALFATSIKEYLKTIPTISSVTNISTKDGIQPFEFMSSITGTYQKSQNVIFRYTAPVETTKTVIIGTSYDVPVQYNAETGEYVSYGNDALNSSSANVASLLALAKFLPEYGFNFNIDFVFFGAGEQSLAGSSFYTAGIADTEAENILCMINLDKIALGEDLYFYTDEVETDFSKYISSLFDTSRIGTKKVNIANLNKTAYIDSGLGLTYTHIALNSDNVNFMKRKIATINLFAGDYDEGIVFGRCEYAKKATITYSKFDTIEYIKANYGADVIEKNLYQVFETIENILTDKNFVETCSSSYNQAGWFYSIFGNQKLIITLTAIAFIIILAIALYIHYKLTVKSYFANVEVEFLSSVVKITEHIDGEGKDKNIPKVVSQVIANDIKKNKTLSPEKPKDKGNDKDENKEK